MKQKKQSKNKPPKGMRIIPFGVVQQGDWAWADTPKHWKELQPTEAGNPISDYHAIARRES